MTTIALSRTSLAAQIAKIIGDAPDGSRSISDVFPLVCEKLRSQGRGLLRRELMDQTLQATGLLHDVLIRFEHSNVVVKDGKHFYMLVIKAMRHLILDAVKSRDRRKRRRTTTEALQALVEIPFDHAATIDLVDVDTALNELAQRSEQAAEVAQLYYFCDLPSAEIASLLNLSLSNVERELRTARSWVAYFEKRTRATKREVGAGGVDVQEP